MKRFHYEQKDLCVAVADLPTHTKEYTPKQIREYIELFQNELDRLQISWWHIKYDREKDTIFAYAHGDWKCVEN